MANVFTFLRSPEASMPVATVYREVRPYGPYEDAGAPAFSAGWLLEIDPAQEPFAQVYAVADGVVAVIPDPEDAALARLALSPLPIASRALVAATGRRVEVPRLFVYAHLERSALEGIFAERIAEAPNPEELSLDERISRFLSGEDWIHVRAGDLVGVAAAAATGWRRIEFEIVTTADNRLDPVAFFTVTREAGLLAPSGDDNSVLLLTQPRILIDTRTEQNRPYRGTVRVTDGGANAIDVIVHADHRGHLTVPAGWSEYRLTIAPPPLTETGRWITELPDGTTAQTTVTRALAPPAHWAVQSLIPDDWFAEPTPAYPAGYALERWTAGNSVTALIDGIETFEAIYQEALDALDPDHFVYLTAWCLQDDVPLGRNQEQSIRLLSEFWKSRGVKLRALVWRVLDYPGGVGGLPNRVPLGCNNAAAVSHMNDGTPTPLAILDSRTLEVRVPLSLNAQMQASEPSSVVRAFSALFVVPQPNGAHHQKFIVISNRNGPVAFCGGIDINSNRLQLPAHYQPQTRFYSDAHVEPYHDVHCKIEGPAVRDFVRTFQHRWNAHPHRPAGDVLSEDPPPRSTTGSCFVQVARSYPAAVRDVFAPDGDRTIFETLRRAIGQAQQYIYIEDQYLVSMAMRDVLLEAMDRIQHLTIVLALSGSGNLGYGTRRQEFLGPLRAAGGDKVRVFTLRNLKGEPIYVHAKLTIIDDVFATVGSACVDRRGYGGDSEINVMVVDGRVEAGARKFARDLRIRLWAEHLGFYNPFTGRYHHLELLEDPIAAADLWFRKSPLNLARVHDENVLHLDIYNAFKPVQPFQREFYELVVDPDGSTGGG